MSLPPTAVEVSLRLLGQWGVLCLFSASISCSQVYTGSELPLRSQPLEECTEWRTLEHEAAPSAGDLVLAWDSVTLPPQPSWSQLLHAFEFLGPTKGSAPSVGEWTSQQILELATDSQKIEERYPGMQLHVLTPKGLLFQDVDGEIKKRMNPSIPVPYDSHPDATVAALAVYGVRSDQEVRVHGNDTTVASAIRYRISSFDLEHEIAWSSVMLALYLPPVRRWSNQFGETCDFDAVCAELASRPLGEGPCFGLHNLYAISVILNADDQVQILSGSARRASLKYLQDIVHMMSSRQMPNGSWLPSLLAADPSGPFADPMESRKHAVTVTGHLVEWAATLPSEITIDSGMIARASVFLTDAIRNPRDKSGFTAITHAARAMRLWNRPEWQRYCAADQNGRVTTTLSVLR